jgi:hypothetical protein
MTCITTVFASARASKVKRGVLALAILLSFTASVVAQDTPIGMPGTQVATEETPAAATNADALRKAAQNPIASLISVPVQNNNNFGIGPDGRVQDILNIQPVMQARLSDKWNLITRVITPIVYQPTVSQPINQGAYGFGDLNPSFFLVPAKTSRVIWGVGPTVVLPTATNPVLGQGKWSIGPSVVVLAQPGKWTLGALVNNVFSFAGQSSRPAVNQMLFQYFINYNLQHGWLKLDPLNNPSAPAGPIFMAEYTNANPQESAKLAEKVKSHFENAVSMRETGDRYVTVTVLLATVLLLTALSQRFEILRPRILVAAVAFALLIMSTYWIVTFPRA